MLEVPQRTAAVNGWDHGVVVLRRRRTGGPLEGPCVPRVISRRLAAEVRPNQIDGEEQHPGGLKDNAYGYDEIPNVPTAARLIGVDAARHAEKPGYVHEIEREMKTDEKQPEVQFGKCFAIHLAGYFRPPIVESGEGGEENCAHN